MNKIVISSTSVDSHGDQMSKEALDGAADIMNGIKKVKWSLEHKREIPPLGYIGNGEVLLHNDIYLLQGETIKHDFVKEVEWDNSLLLEGYNEPIAYNEVEDTDSDMFSISVDTNNLTSYSEFHVLDREFKKIFETDVDLQMHTRKSQLPSPELIFILDTIKWGLLLYNPLTKKFAEKIAEKFAEDVYTETKKKAKQLRDLIIRSVKLTRAKSTPKNKALKTVFHVHGKPHIELVASDDTGDVLVKGLSAKNMNEMYDAVKTFQTHCVVTKIQFVLSSKGKWIFTYLYTDKGETIGTKAVFKERDKLLKRLELMDRK